MKQQGSALWDRVIKSLNVEQRHLEKALSSTQGGKTLNDASKG